MKDVDEVAVERRCRGDRSVALNGREVKVAFLRLDGAGLSLAEIAERLGVSDRAVCRWRAGARPKSLEGAA